MKNANAHSRSGSLVTLPGRILGISITVLVPTAVWTAVLAFVGVPRPALVAAAISIAIYCLFVGAVVASGKNHPPSDDEIKQPELEAEHATAKPQDRHLAPGPLGSELPNGRQRPNLSQHGAF
jgi:hypothetical protein